MAVRATTALKQQNLHVTFEMVEVKGLVHHLNLNIPQNAGI